MIFPQAYYFDRDDIAYKGFSAFFKKNSDEERDHGEKFIKYQNRRGGKVVFQDIAKPTTMEWGTPLEAMEAALELEKTVSILMIILTFILTTTPPHRANIDFPLPLSRIETCLYDGTCFVSLQAKSKSDTVATTDNR